MLQLTGVPIGNVWECSDTNINDRMRKTKTTLFSACMYHGLIWTLDEEVYLLLCMEGSLFLIPQDDMTTDSDICGHVKTCQWNLSASTTKFTQLGALLRHGCYVAVECWLVVGTAEVQVGDPCSLTQYNSV